MTERKPVLEIKLDGLWCSLHAEPWAPTWDQHARAAARAEITGPLLAGLKLVDALLARPEVAARYSGHIEAFRQEDWQPICCYLARLEPETVRAAYAAAGVAPPRREG